MIKCTLKEFCDNLSNYLNNHVQVTVKVVYDRTEVNYGMEEDCNIQWCNDNNIPCYNIYRSAGCCVNAAGNINIADIRPNNKGWVEQKIMPDFRDWLISKGLNVTLDNNDILIDGYKVASAGGFNLAPDYKWGYTCIQFSINQDLYVMEHACKNPSKKPAKGMSEWGITTDDISEWVENWFEEYDKA